jgi:hypothetical protein
MNRERWLAVMLLASWTLNVTLVVAWFMRQTYPAGIFPPERAPGAYAPRDFPPPPGWPGPGKPEEAAEMHRTRMDLMSDLAAAFDEESLDTARIRRISDSLWSIRSEMQRRFVSQMIQSQASMSPEDRRQYCRWMMGGEGHRRDGLKRDSGHRMGGRH